PFIARVACAPKYLANHYERIALIVWNGRACRNVVGDLVIPVACSHGIEPRVYRLVEARNEAVPIDAAGQRIQPCISAESPEALRVESHHFALRIGTTLP